MRLALAMMVCFAGLYVMGADESRILEEYTLKDGRVLRVDCAKRIASDGEVSFMVTLADGSKVYFGGNELVSSREVREAIQVKDDRARTSNGALVLQPVPAQEIPQLRIGPALRDEAPVAQQPQVPPQDPNNFFPCRGITPHGQGNGGGGGVTGNGQGNNNNGGISNSVQVNVVMGRAPNGTTAGGVLNQNALNNLLNGGLMIGSSGSFGTSNTTNGYGVGVLTGGSSKAGTGQTLKQQIMNQQSGGELPRSTIGGAGISVLGGGKH